MVYYHHSFCTFVNKWATTLCMDGVDTYVLRGRRYTLVLLQHWKPTFETTRLDCTRRYKPTRRSGGGLVDACWRDPDVAHIPR
jgi:hypothetical protein